jgi:hypothetical protein
LSQQIKEIEKRMTEITELKKHIINYAKTKEIYTAYRESGYSTKFYEKNIQNLLLYNHAKKAFNLMSSDKISTLETLQLEYKECLNTRKELLSI